MEFHTGGSLLREVALALGGHFHPFGFFGWILEVAEPLIAPGLGLGSLGIGSPFSDSP
jgi:hypothetical protein